MLKFAAFQITSAVLVSQDMSRTAARQLTAHRAVFDYEPRPGYLYVRSRAISSRCNDNFDEFPAEEIKSAYRTFIGKPVFVNHHNDNHRRMRGVIIDAALHEDRNHDGTPDTWAEVLMEVDAVRFPMLAKAILAGEIDRTSMGTDVAYSICSACGNKATSPAEYCAHIPRMKGKRIYQVTGSSGAKEGVLVREKCFGLKFFENSLLVEEPADPTAYFLGVDDRGMKMNASLDPAEPKPADQAARMDGVTLAKDDEGYYVRTHRARSDSFETPAAIPDKDVKFIESTGSKTAERIEFSPEEQAFHQHMRDAGEMSAQMGEHARNRVVDLNDPHDLKSHLVESHGWTDDDFWRNSHDHDHPAMMSGTDEDRSLTHGEIQGAHEHEHNVEYPHDYPNAVTMGDSHFHEANRHTAGPMHGPAKGSDERHKHRTTSHCRSCGSDIYLVNGGWQHDIDSGAGVPHMAVPADSDDGDGDADGDDAGAGGTTASLSVEAASKAEDFFAANPPSAHHIVERFKSATPEQHDAGMNWYSDAHHVAKAIGHGDTAKAAGLMGVYSAGTPVAPNYHYASRAIIHNTAVGGKVNPIPPEHSDFHGKPNASGLQAEQATRMLGGEHHSTVLTSPKVSNYSHLIEHGGNEPGRDAPGRVVVDRHAVSAAIGRRITDSEFGSLNLSSTDNGKKIKGGGGAVHDYGDDRNSRYHHIANIYRQAADQLRSEGHDVEPHQVQAVAWGVQKGRNDAEDAAHVEAQGPQSGNIKGRQNSQERQRDAWENHYKTQHDNLGAPENPRGHWGAKGWVPSESDLLDFEDHMRTVAYGEVKAPADVDTLRDEECPVCGEGDSYDGNACQVCGFDAPPQMFQDPNLDLAKSLDLRKDIAEDAGNLPGMAQDGMTPGQQDANGGMPGEVPGETVPGSDQIPVPVDPSAVDADGDVTPTTDPAQIAQQQMELLQSGTPITPDMIGPNGEVMSAGIEPGLDPDAATGHFDQGGEAFTPGPNAPGEPGEPEGPVSPDDVDENGDIAAEGPEKADDGQDLAPPAGQGDPGTPDDGVADVQCPACGFQADGVQPTSTDMDQSATPAPEGGTLPGDVCPNCGQAQLMSVGEMEQMQQQPMV